MGRFRPVEGNQFKLKKIYEVCFLTSKTLIQTMGIFLCHKFEQHVAEEIVLKDAKLNI